MGGIVLVIVLPVMLPRIDLTNMVQERRTVVARARVVGRAARGPGR
jgi:hypothetical protein